MDITYDDDEQPVAAAKGPPPSGRTSAPPSGRTSAPPNVRYDACAWKADRAKQEPDPAVRRSSADLEQLQRASREWSAWQLRSPLGGLAQVPALAPQPQPTPATATISSAAPVAEGAAQIDEYKVEADGSISGRVYGHASYRDGEAFQTSRVLDEFLSQMPHAAPPLILTKSGSTYRLGAPAPPPAAPAPPASEPGHEPSCSIVISIASRSPR